MDQYKKTKQGASEEDDMLLLQTLFKETLLGRSKQNSHSLHNRPSMTYADIDKNWEIYIEKDEYTVAWNSKKEINVVNVETVVFMHHFTCDRFTRIALVEERTGEVFFNKKNQWSCQWCKCEFPLEVETLKEQIKKYVVLFDLANFNI